jgi:hypothetical protein
MIALVFGFLALLIGFFLYIIIKETNKPNYQQLENDESSNQSSVSTNDENKMHCTMCGSSSHTLGTCPIFMSMNNS